MKTRFVLAGVLLLTAGPARSEGALPAPGVATTTIVLGASAAGEHEGAGSFVFRNPGPGSMRLVLPGRGDDEVSCTPDGDRTSRSRPGQFTIAAESELPCTAPSGSHRFTSIGSEGGAIRERSGRLVVR